MVLSICDITQTAIFDFPNNGTLDDFLKEKGMYPSTTYFFLRSQPKDTIDCEFEEDNNFLQEVMNTVDSACEAGSTSCNNVSPASQYSTVCVNCSCMYMEGDICLNCNQSNDFEKQLEVDREIELNTLLPDSQHLATFSEDPVSRNLTDMRQQRVAFFSRQGENNDMHSPVECVSTAVSDSIEQPQQSPTRSEIGQNCFSNTPATNPSATNPLLPPALLPVPALPTQPLSFQHQCMDPPRESPPPPAPSRELVVHRSHITKDLITHFKDPTIMECALFFKMINERGETEKGEGIGVLREVFTLFWGEFAISMTIGERERVPFVRHDHFIEEWEAIGRILVKSYTSVKYYPLFLSQAFICYCLFGNQVPDDLILSSFLKYLAPEEEKLLQPILDTSTLPSNREEFDDFLERFNCRTVVSNANCLKVLLEIAQQELIQKPHVMIASWQSTCHQLKLYPAFNTIAAVKTNYDSLLPTNKKVLDMLVANPTNDAERDALKFLQRFIRGLEMSKLVKFLRFTTAMDVVVGNKLNISFIKSEGFGSRPIAHTCGPVLELPTSYANHVELRGQFANVLRRDDWEIDIV